MVRIQKTVAAVAVLPLALALTGFSHTTKPERKLESITLSPASAKGAKAKFTATGKFNTAPTKVTPIPVSWYLMGPAIDPPPPGYSLVDADFKPVRCNASAANPVEFHYTVIAVAPADPKAPKSGSMPIKVFEDLVIQHTKTSEGGFIAGTAKLACP